MNRSLGLSRALGEWTSRHLFIPWARGLHFQMVGHAQWEARKEPGSQETIDTAGVHPE